MKKLTDSSLKELRQRYTDNLTHFSAKRDNAEAANEEHMARYYGAMATAAEELLASVNEKLASRK